MKYSLICPLCEPNALLPLTLEAMFRLDRDDYEIIFAAEPDARAAVLVAEQIARRYPLIPTKFVVVAKTYCVNPKLNNLQKGWLVASGAWILMTDCNVLLPPDALHQLEARWTDQVGMVCSPPLGAQPDNFWAEVECAFLNQFQAKWQLGVDRLGYGFVQGKVMFCHKAQFDRLGGLLPLDHNPCEDAAATKLIRQAGLRVRLVRKLFEQPLGHRSLANIWHRQLRWAKLRRVTFPFCYALEIFASPIPFLLALFGTPLIWVGLSFVASYAFEIGLAKWAGWYLSWRSPLAMLARDVLMVGVWLMGWFGDEFTWAGQTLTLHPTADELIQVG